MKKAMIGIAVAMLIATPAVAADLALKGPPPPPLPPPAVTWTGCYINGGFGYGLWNQEQYGESFPGLVQASGSETMGGRGWLGTVGGGCDYEIVPRFVVGALADYDFMNIHGNFSPGDLADFGTSKETSAWSAGGRVGYLVTPSLLTYFSGGYTQTRFGQSNFDLLFAPFTPTDSMPAHTYHGWFLGSGLEYALNFDWLPIRGLFLRTEYRYSSYRSADLPLNFSGTSTPTVSLACSPGALTLATCGEHITPYVQTITTSLVWKFNWAAPPVTRY